MPLDAEYIMYTNTDTGIAHSDSPKPCMNNAQALLDWVISDPDLKEQDRRNAMGAIRWLGKVDDTSLSAIPLETHYLVGNRYGCIRKHPGLNERRKTEVISLLNRVLKRAGILSVGTKRSGRTSLTWIQIMHLLPKDDAKSLSPLAKFCSARSVEPGQAVLDVWPEFVDETINRSACKKPRETINRVVRASERARKSDPTWLLPELIGPVNPRYYSLPETVVPQSFWADVNDYHTKSTTKPPSIFAKNWPSRLKVDTVERHRDELWRLASAQIRSGRPADAITDLKALLDLESVEAGLNWMCQHAGDQPLRSHLNIAGTLISVAKRWLRDEFLAQTIREDIFDVIAEELGPAEFSEKNVRKLDQFDNAEKVNAFLVLPYSIWAEMQKKEKLTVDDAVEMAVAVAIEILLSTLMRRKNLVNLDLAQHFWPQQPTPQGKWVIHLDATEVKNAKALDFRLRPTTIALIQYYIRHCRPLLITQPTSRLFLRTDGTPMLGQDMYHLVTKQVRDRLGLDVHLHLFRQIGAMLFLDQHPGKIGVVKVMLGHKTEKTTEKFYARLKATKAIEFFTEAVLGGREAMIKKLSVI